MKYMVKRTPCAGISFIKSIIAQLAFVNAQIMKHTFLRLMFRITPMMDKLVKSQDMHSNSMVSFPSMSIYVLWPLEVCN